jgi:hypothetical protein
MFKKNKTNEFCTPTGDSSLSKHHKVVINYFQATILCLSDFLTFHFTPEQDNNADMEDDGIYGDN